MLRWPTRKCGCTSIGESVRALYIESLASKNGRSDVFLFENPSERPLVVREHLTDALVVHVLVVELFFQELVLLADLLFVSHA